MLAYKKKLKKLYKSDRDKKFLIKEKEKIFQRLASKVSSKNSPVPWNNARILLYGIYEPNIENFTSIWKCVDDKKISSLLKYIKKQPPEKVKNLIQARHKIEWKCAS